MIYVHTQSIILPHDRQDVCMYVVLSLYHYPVFYFTEDEVDTEGEKVEFFTSLHNHSAHH